MKYWQRLLDNDLIFPRVMWDADDDKGGGDGSDADDKSGDDDSTDDKAIKALRSERDARKAADKRARDAETKLDKLEQDKLEIADENFDHGTLTGLSDDDHKQYRLNTFLESETTGEGGSVVGFDDTGSKTTAVDVNDIINRILVDIGYAEAAVGTGALDFSDADNSHHIATVA